MTNEEIQVESWNIDQLTKLGLSDDQVIVALNQSIDWHELDNLLKNGCTKELAIRILA